jgi:DNA transposition AAA+ family ATPase
MSITVKTTAPLSNVAAFGEMLLRVLHRKTHLPGFAVMFGPSGYGKTVAATYAAHIHQAHYIEVGESWTKRKFLASLVQELGGQPHGMASDLVDQAIELLAVTPRPILIDEFDHVMKRGYHDTLREIHDKVPGATIIVIGEELLPARIKQYERWHNRVLDWLPAEPSTVSDAAHLAKLYCDRLEFAEDLLARIVEVSAGRIRRICVNLERVREAAQVERVASVDLAWWGGRELWTGQAPARRAV